MISLKICCLILCVHYVLLFSIWYLSDWSYYLVNVQGWCHSILVIPFDFLTGMVPFHLVIYFWSYHLIFLQGWCHYHFGQLFLVNYFWSYHLICIQGWCQFHFEWSSFDPNTIMTWFELIFSLLFIFLAFPFFQEWCHFHFKPVERDILALFFKEHFGHYEATPDFINL